MRIWLVAALLGPGLLLPLMAEAHEASNKGVTVAHPWVRASPGGTTLTAGFMEIKTASDVSDALITAVSPAAGRVEVHTHIMEGDVMKMRRVERLELKPGQSHVLKPSGDHLMLMDLKSPLKEGDMVKLTLTFEKAGAIDVEATVEPPGAMGPHGMDHQPGAEDDNMRGGHDHH